MTKLKQLKILLWLKKAPYVPIIILGSFLFVVIFADFIAPYSPTDMNLPNRLAPPGSEGHILGTDELGRDLLTRLFYGGRISLIVAGFVLVIAGTIGLTVGIVSGYLGGIVDVIMMRIVDMFLSFPPILLAIIMAISLKPGLKTVILAISLTFWARFARIIRVEVLQIKEQEFIALAKVAGCSPLYIMVRHILPNVLDTHMVIMSLQVGMVILMEATLSFLGAGVPPPTPSWGMMVGDGRNYINTAWWICLIPGGALATIILSFNMLGDWLRDVRDPHLRAGMGE